ncbi:hypothetical protein Bca4012_025186 [Brassica carinata]
MSTVTGTNTKKAMKTKNTPVFGRIKLKYIKAFSEGILLVADCKPPEYTCLPFDTILIGSYGDESKPGMNVNMNMVAISKEKKKEHKWSSLLQ